MTYFFKLNDLKEILATFLWFHCWTFQKSLLFVEITASFIFQLILWCDIIKFLNHKPEEWKSFPWYHIVGIHKLWFSLKLFDLSSRALEITTVLSFFRKFSWILKKEEKHCNSENIEDLRKVQRQIFFKIVQVSLRLFSSKKWVIEFYTQLFKDLKPMLCFNIQGPGVLQMPCVFIDSPGVTEYFHTIDWILTLLG